MVLHGLVWRSIKNIVLRPKNQHIYKTSKILAHDQEMVSKVGDIVLIEESKPISKNKSWVLTQVIKAGQEE